MRPTAALDLLGLLDLTPSGYDGGMVDFGDTAEPRDSKAPPGSARQSISRWSHVPPVADEASVADLMPVLAALRAPGA